jgi:hypothetical protein
MSDPGASPGFIGGVVASTAFVTAALAKGIPLLVAWIGKPNAPQTPPPAVAAPREPSHADEKAQEFREVVLVALAELRGEIRVLRTEIVALKEQREAAKS